MSSSSATKLAFCITELNVGGAERMLVELVLRLDPARYQPTVFSLAPRPVADDLLPRRLEEADIPVQFLEGRSRRSAPGVYRRLRGALTELQPQLVQTMLWHANTLGVVAARRAKVPHVVTGIRVADRRRTRHWWTRRVERFVDRHVCVSQAVADFAVQRMKLPRDKLLVIENGVEAGEFPRSPLDLTELGLQPGRRALLFVGRLDTQKRPDWLLRRMPEILARLPSHDLLVVGQGPLHGSLLRLVDRLKLAGRVHFLGWRSDVPSILAASDLLLLTSRNEGMPNVVLEAMASSKPVVVTRTEGVEELLPDAESQIVDRGDAHEFVRRVSHLARSEALCRELGAANRHRVETQFTLEKMIASYTTLYDHLCASSAP